MKLAILQDVFDILAISLFYKEILEVFCKF